MKAAGIVLTQFFLFCSFLGHAQELRQHQITDIHTEHRLEREVLAAVEWDITVNVKAELDVAYNSCIRNLKTQIIRAIAATVNQTGTIKQVEMLVPSNCHIGDVSISANPSVCFHRDGARPVCKVREASAL